MLFALVCILAVLLVLAGMPFCIKECRKQKGDVPKVAPAPHDAVEDDSSDSDSETESTAPVVEPPATQEPQDGDAKEADLQIVHDGQADMESSVQPPKAIPSADPLEVPETASEKQTGDAATREHSSTIAARKLLPPLGSRPIAPPITRHINRHHIPPDS